MRRGFLYVASISWLPLDSRRRRHSTYGLTRLGTDSMSKSGHHTTRLVRIGFAARDLAKCRGENGDVDWKFVVRTVREHDARSVDHLAAALSAQHDFVHAYHLPRVNPHRSPLHIEDLMEGDRCGGSKRVSHHGLAAFMLNWCVGHLRPPLAVEHFGGDLEEGLGDRILDRVEDAIRDLVLDVAVALLLRR